MGLVPEGNYALMKLCISVGLPNVKVGLVLREIKTLLEFMLAVPTRDSAGSPAGAELLAGLAGAGAGVEFVAGLAGAGVGAVDLQTEGWPLHTNPV